MKRLFAIAVGTLAVLGGCSISPATYDADNGVARLTNGTGQNFQVWPDGSVQGGNTQLDSGTIDSDTIDWQGTAISGLLAATKNGLGVKNPGNLSADNLEIVFGDPVADADGSLIVPIGSISITNLSNEVTSVIDASTEQVAFWAEVLPQLSEDQRDVAITQLETLGQISADAAEALRAIFVPVLVP